MDSYYRYIVIGTNDTHIAGFGLYEDDVTAYYAVQDKFKNEFPKQDIRYTLVFNVLTKKCVTYGNDEIAKRCYDKIDSTLKAALK